MLEPIYERLLETVAMGVDEATSHGEVNAQGVSHTDTAWSEPAHEPARAALERAAFCLWGIATAAKGDEGWLGVGVLARLLEFACGPTSPAPLEKVALYTAVALDELMRHEASEQRESTTPPPSSHPCTYGAQFVSSLKTVHVRYVQKTTWRVHTRRV